MAAAAGAKGRPQGKPRGFKVMEIAKLEAGLNASLELQCRETWKLDKTRQGRLRGRPQGLKAMEIGAKQYDKEGDLFWTSKREKKQACKHGPPQFKIPAAAVADQISFSLK